MCVFVFSSQPDNCIGLCLSGILSIHDCLRSNFELFMYVNREISDDLGHPVNCISLSNDGNCVLANCLDSTLRLLDR